MDNNVYQVYEDEIQALEEEIKLLTEKYEDIQQESTFFSEEEILKSIKSFQRETQGESKGHESPSDLKAQLESLETDLSFLMKLTGFQFTSHSKKTVEKTRDRTVQKHRLSGNCHSLSFQLEFQLLEVQSKEKVSSVISDLNIVMESGEDSGMSEFVSSVEERGNLATFFRSLSAYAEWVEHRRRTFLHFKAKYPEVVTLPEGLQGDYIILRNPKVSGFELMIVWKIHLDEEGTTTPVLDLLTKVPEQVLEQKMTRVESVPARFRSMVLLLGIEAALENLIKVLE
ncbi:centromere protein P [Pipra filicauda]|uniref:Centromere protein P n=1 Tax=Pipra filicauda TaxID=649802 RepID=A0A6J2HY52_9PASS|nr:centromere protein P [Pipra filicauda]XP_027592344.1 centromere protein P [Pipra filicauda]XP_027592421.1 centromere protein P [Pipra filicauda]XP_027592493.1 centromere protein P [Pipra filicauda]XP_039234259.1 centromere protein P [Pipra filicauda]